MKPRSVSAVSWPLLGILAGGLALRVALSLLHAGRHEIETYEQWARMLALFGTHGLYGHTAPWNALPYHEGPGLALLILAIERIYGALRPAHDDPILLGMLFRALPSLADLASAAIAYSIVVRYASRAEATFAAAIAAFAPWTWPLSAVAGEPVSIAAMFVLLALEFALDEHFTIAWLALGAAAIVSPIACAAAPLLFVVELRSDGVSGRSALGPFVALALACGAALPFSPLLAPTSALAWLAHLYLGVNWATSNSAANVWAVLAKPAAATHPFFRLTYAWYGLIAVTAFELLVVAVASRRIAAAKSKIERSQTIVAAWFVTLFIAFVFATGMRERDLAYALWLVPAIWALGPEARRIAVTLTATFAANLVLAMFFSGHPNLVSAIALRVLAFVNVLALVYALAWFAWREAPVKEDWGGQRVP